MTPGVEFARVVAGSAYSGPAPLTVAHAVASWTVDVPAAAAVAVLAAAYLAGVRRVRAGGGSWPTRRVAAFCGGGLGSLVVATMSGLGVYEPVLFAARSIQTVLLLLVVPLFLVLGRPLTLLITAVPGTRGRVAAALDTRLARALTFPALTAAVLVVVPFLFYFSSWYQAGLRDAFVGELTRAVLVAPGLVFFWTLLRVDPVPKAYPYVVSLWVSGVEVIGDAILGLAVLADPNLIASAYYHALARPWGPTLRADQVIGGGALWVLGDIVGLPYFAAQLIHMMREDEADAVRIDAELDAAEAAQARVGAAAGAASDAVPGGAERAAAPAGPHSAGSAPTSHPVSPVSPAARVGPVSPVGPDGSGGCGEPAGVAGQSVSPEPAGPAGSGAPRQPWWESDPRFTGRFRRSSG